MSKITKATRAAIVKHIEAKENRFYVGAYYYEADMSSSKIIKIRRREQMAGRTPSSDWEVVARDNKFL